MKVEGAIRKAIEGGWGLAEDFDKGWDWFTTPWSVVSPKALLDTMVEIKTQGLAKVFLDPSFWQSLGRALGWKEFSREKMSIHGTS